ncbi:unnamed protein product, partial [Ixodes pacificus]
RCGALHVGDQLLAIDGTQVDQMSPAEAMQLLRMSVGDIIRLEILPISQMALRRWPSSSHSKRGGAMPAPPHGYASNYDTLSSVGAHSSRRNALPTHNQFVHSHCDEIDRVCRHARAASTSSVYGTVPACLPPSGQLSHTETTQVAVCADHKGFGFTLQGDVPPSAPTIVGIDPRGPAERTGVIQIGDRVIAVNGQTTEGMSAEEVTQMVQRSRPRVVLDIDFDVAESVVPSSGTFTVKLAKKGPGLGITITSPKHRRPGEPLLISDIKRGSVAHRTGTLQPGDHLLAIDCVRMDNCTIEDAAQILQASDEVVKLRIRKDDAFCEEPDATGAVVFTVELARHGGPLGITISGTEEPFDPIVISGLTEGGLAERTGALHVGDRILAINGQSLRGKPLSEAILSLQNSGDVVTLKISKSPINQGTKSSRSYLSMYGTPIPSVDSAVESWDSYGGPEAMAALANGTAPAKPTEKEGKRVTCAMLPLVQSTDVSTCHPLPVPGADKLTDTAKFPSKRALSFSGRSAASDSGSADWTKVLEDLETCGQSKLLRQIERSIMGSLPSI